MRRRPPSADDGRNAPCPARVGQRPHVVAVDLDGHGPLEQGHRDHEPELVLDPRDDPFDARRGWFHSSLLEYSATALGSDLPFAKYLLQQYYYRPTGPVTLASALRFGVAAAFDDQELIRSERFFAGGGNSVRGYDEDSLGPTGFFGPTGGNSLLELKQEVRFPIAWWFRGVGFVDAGNVFATLGDVALGDLKVGAGLGLRVDTPFALLRFDYGFALNRDPGAPKGRFFFSLGQAF